MSLMKTLARVAIGVAIAKGVGSMMQKSRQGSAGADAGSGGLFGGPNAPRPQTGGAPGGLQDIMQDVLGGNASPRRTGQGAGGVTSSASAGGDMGGLGGLLEQLSGGAAGGAARRAPGGAAPAGGLDDLLGQLQKGGLGGLVGGLAGALGGAAAGQAAPSGNGAAPGGAQPSFGELLNQSLKNYGEPDVPPAPQQEAAAALMLRAMIQAAKADGKVDEGERKKLLDSLADATEAEMDFVKAELPAPVDIAGLAGQVPKGLGAQVYTMSVMAITLDNKVEAQYLHELAQALGLAPEQVNQIHAQLGVPALYS